MTVAAVLIAADLALQRGIARWHGAGPPPAAVVQAATTEERIELRMARDPRLERGVLAKLPARLARDAADDVAARRDLLRLAPHKPGPPVRLGPALPVLRLRSYYAEGQRRSAVPWQVLAAVNFVESDFGRLREPSSSGAQGPMQFIPSTWAAYGRGTFTTRMRRSSLRPGSSEPPGRRTTSAEPSFATTPRACTSTRSSATRDGSAGTRLPCWFSTPDCRWCVRILPAPGVPGADFVTRRPL